MNFPENFSNTDKPGHGMPGPDWKRNLAVLFLFLGLALIAWIVSVAWHLFHGGAEIDLVTQIFVRSDFEPIVIKTMGDEIEIPASLLMVAGYFLTIMLLGVLAGLAKTLIQIGIRLFQTDRTTSNLPH